MGGGFTTVATGAGTRVDVTLKLPQLQNLCKRDPAGYREDYDAQVRRLESELGLLCMNPNNNAGGSSSSSRPGDQCVELIQFAAAVSSSSYKGQESDRIAGILMDLLKNNNAVHLHRDVRKACVSALILMRNKGAVAPLDLLELFFEIMSTVSDKNLRELLFRHTVNDVRNINKNGKRDDKVNRSVQSFLHRVVQNPESNEIASKRAVDMVCELYRRRVWTDERTVAILASAIESPLTNVSTRAMRFFLNIEEKMAEDTRQRQEGEWLEKHGAVDLHLHSRKTKRRQRQTGRALKNRKKAQQKKETAQHEDWMDMDASVESSKKLYPAIELLRDPQGLAESVFKKLKAGGSTKYETKLLMINFVTRIIGNHELLVLPLYAFLQKYMGGHQRDVTAVLAYTVQACHEQVPPDEIYGILKTIAHNFITERCSEEQMAVGINAVRAICTRVPSTMSAEEQWDSTTEATGAAVSMDMEAFARDLAAYANHRDRSVSIAGKAWMNFVREVHPALLQGKDRGMKGSALHKAGIKPLKYGEQKVATGVEGADLLAEYEAKKAALKKTDGDEESDSASSGEWQDLDDDDKDGSEDEDAPDLVLLEGCQKPKAQLETGIDDDGKPPLDLSKMSAEERDKLKQQVSSTRVFTTAEFEKMQKLVERERRAKRDPREAARRKRAIARGHDFEALSGSDTDSEVEEVNIKGAVNPEDIMALASRKRQSKAEKLEKILAGRSKFESKQREGGSTNIEKKRKKNFQMSKFSKTARRKGRGKGGLQRKKREISLSGTHEAKKRRRKL